MSVEKLIDHLPFVDGSGRRRFVAGGIILIGIAVQNSDMFKTVLSANKIDVGDILGSPSIVAGAVLLVYALGSLAEMLGELSLVRAASGIFLALQLPGKIVTWDTVPSRHWFYGFLIIVIKTLLFMTFVPFMLIFYTVAGFVGYTKYTIDIRRRTSDEAWDVFQKLPAAAQRGLSMPVGNETDFAQKCIVDLLSSEPDRKWARRLIIRAKDVAATVTALQVVLLYAITFGFLSTGVIWENSEQTVGKSAQLKVKAQAVVDTEKKLREKKELRLPLRLDYITRVANSNGDLGTISPQKTIDRLNRRQNNLRKQINSVKKESNIARVWDATSGKSIATLTGHKGTVRSAAFNHDGRRIVTASADRTARVWDATSGKSIATLTGHKGTVYSAAFNHDSSRIVTASADRTARVWNATSGKSITTLTGHKGTVYSAAFNHDGRRIVTASSDRTARVWDATSGKSIVTLTGHKGTVYSAAFNHDGRRIVTASSDRTARVWDATSGKSIATLTGHKGTVYSAAFNHDGRRIVTASSDRTARVWDATSGKSIATLTGHKGTVYSAAFNHDGRRIVTASSDRTARVWDATSGKSIATLAGHKDRVYSAAFNHDSSRIVTAAANPPYTASIRREFDRNKLILDMAETPEIKPLIQTLDDAISRYNESYREEKNRILAENAEKISLQTLLWFLFLPLYLGYFTTLRNAIAAILEEIATAGNKAAVKESGD